MFFNILGYVAATLTTIAFVPQVIKVIRTGKTETISLYMYLAFVLGVIGWLVYGFHRQDYAIIAANGITAILAMIILIYKIIHVVNGEKP